MDLSFDTDEIFFFLAIVPWFEASSIKSLDVELLYKSIEFPIYSIDAKQFDQLYRYEIQGKYCLSDFSILLYSCVYSYYGVYGCYYN